MPNFVKGLDGQLLPGTPKRITEQDTLAFMDAGAYCNIRAWIARKLEISDNCSAYTPLFRRGCDVIIALDASADNQPLWFQRAQEFADKMQLTTWPKIQFDGLFPSPNSDSAGDKLQEAEAQAEQMDPTPRPTVPTHAEEEKNEPDLERVNVWIGSSDKGKAESCRVLSEDDMYEAAKQRDGVALVYIASLRLGAEGELTFA
jgi:phospholipase A2